VVELLGPSQNALRPVPHLDVSRPNIHHSKKEFLRELAAVQAALDRASGALNALLPEDGDTEAEAMTMRIGRAIDDRARRSRSRLQVHDVTSLLRKNLADTGFYINALWALVDLSSDLQDRRNELKDQEKQYWAVNHRPANHYARAIALRLARLYAQEKGIRPTFGTARDGGHPSTDYGRALEQIFAALDIKGSVRNPAKWAIDQLTEEDVRPARSILGGLLGVSAGQRSSGEPRNALADIMGALEKGPEK
jgi:hypothetical protein